MPTTFLAGKNFNALTGSFIMRADGIPKHETAHIMGWAKCDLLGIETLALEDKSMRLLHTYATDIKTVAMHSITSSGKVGIDGRSRQRYEERLTKTAKLPMVRLR